MNERAFWDRPDGVRRNRFRAIFFGRHHLGESTAPPVRALVALNPLPRGGGAAWGLPWSKRVA
jgi:hypothetical protein